MELSEEDIKRRIASKEICAITLDTSIFDSNGNRFEHGLLARLNQFNTTAVGFVVSDVVAGEVLRHVTQEAVEARSKITTALKEVGKAWQVTPEQRTAAIAGLFGTETPEDLANRRFDAFVDATGLVIIESSGRIDISRMLAAYFSSDPPFGKSAAKKNEFPDAIALQALEFWAKERDVLLLAVSKDSDWKKYGKTSNHLVVTDDLALALSYFHQNGDVACARLASRVASGDLSLDDTLWGAVEAAVERSVFVPEVSSGYHFDADVDEVRLISVTLDEMANLSGPFRVIDKPSETVLVVEAEVEAEIEVSADFTFSITDSIDRDEVAIGSAHARTQKTQTFNVLLTFEGDLSENAELIDAEVVAKRGSVYVYVDFGDLGPEWEEEPEPDDMDA